MARLGRPGTWDCTHGWTRGSIPENWVLQICYAIWMCLDRNGHAKVFNSIVVKLANRSICVVNGKGCQPFELSQVGFLGNRLKRRCVCTHHSLGPALRKTSVGKWEKQNWAAGEIELWCGGSKGLGGFCGELWKCQRWTLFSCGARCWAFVSSVWTSIGCKQPVEKARHSAMGNCWQNRVAHSSIHDTNVMLHCVYWKSSFPFIVCVTQFKLLSCPLSQSPHLKMRVIMVPTSQSCFKNKIQLKQLEHWLPYSKQWKSINEYWSL